MARRVAYRTLAHDLRNLAGNPSKRLESMSELLTMKPLYFPFDTSHRAQTLEIFDAPFYIMNGLIASLRD